MNYIEIEVNVTPLEPGRDVLIASFSDLNYESFQDTESGFMAYIQEKNYSKSQLQDLCSQYAPIFEINTVEKSIPQQNWNKVWESNIKPIDIDGECYIRAPFHSTPEEKKYHYEVIIEPKMSFGTGHHDTTQLMVKEMMGVDLKDRSVLDMGCGTGVLAILASKMEASEVLAVDIDEWSYENSIENALRNKADKVLVKKGSIEIIAGKLFFVILANINKNVLMESMSQYVDSLEDNGHLLLSGFFETDIDDLKRMADKLGLKLVNILSNNSWALLHFSKN